MNWQMAEEKEVIFTAILIVDSKKRLHNEGVIFNIDFKKAYDYVERGFVDYMLYGFGSGVEVERVDSRI